MKATTRSDATEFQSAVRGLRIAAQRTKAEIGQPQSETRVRRGAVAVEFAIVAPILVAVLFGLIELGRAFEMQNLLDVAAREGARFASMDRNGLLDPGESANAKMVEDVKTFLASNGIEKNSITVEIKDFENPEQDFDLDDPTNDLKLFEVQVSVDWSDMSLTPIAAGQDHAMTASVVFRNGRATISD